MACQSSPPIENLKFKIENLNCVGGEAAKACGLPTTTTKNTTIYQRREFLLAVVTFVATVVTSGHVNFFAICVSTLLTVRAEWTDPLTLRSI